MGAQRSVKHASKKTSETPAPKASFSHFLELDFGGQQLEEATQSAPRCGGVGKKKKVFNDHETNEPKRIMAQPATRK